MVRVFRPPKRLLLPNQQYRVDWQHPISKGLVACWVPGISLVDLGPSSLALTPDTAANPFSRANQEGPAYPYTAANMGAYATAPALMQVSQPFTVYWRGSFLGASGASNQIAQEFFGCSTTTTDTDPFFAYSLGIGGNDGQGSNIFDQSMINFSYSGNAGVDIKHIWKAGGIDTSNYGRQVYGIAGLMRSLSSEALYINGISVATGSDSFTTTAPKYGTSPQIGLGYSPVKARFPNSLTNLACVWNRALSDAELIALEDDPYGFLLPAEQEWPSLFTSSSALSGSAKGWAFALGGLGPGAGVGVLNARGEAMASGKVAQSGAAPASAKGEAVGAGRAAYTAAGAAQAKGEVIGRGNLGPGAGKGAATARGEAIASGRLAGSGVGVLAARGLAAAFGAARGGQLLFGAARGFATAFGVGFAAGVARPQARGAATARASGAGALKGAAAARGQAVAAGKPGGAGTGSLSASGHASAFGAGALVGRIGGAATGRAVATGRALLTGAGHLAARGLAVASGSAFGRGLLHVGRRLVMLMRTIRGN